MMKKKEKTSFGNFFSPYMTTEKTNMDSWYEDYKIDPDKTVIINGYVHQKIIHRCEFYVGEPCLMIVSIDPIDNLQLEDILIDENGNESVIKGFEMIHFTKIPEWYPRIRPILIQGTTYNIGQYLAKKSAT